MEATSRTKRREPPELYGGALRLSRAIHERDRGTPRDSPHPPQAGRRAAQLREGARGRARGLRRGRREHLAGGRSRAAPGVGIGTLYRHFPNRQALLEALYVDEVTEVCHTAERARRQRSVGGPRTAGSTASSPTWRPSRRSSHELLNYLERDAALFQSCRAATVRRRRAAPRARPGGGRRALRRRHRARSSRW